MKWKLVPVEPTEEMIDEGRLYIELPDDEDGTAIECVDLREVFRAMLAAAPPATEDAELIERVAKALDRHAWYALDHTAVKWRRRRVVSIQAARAALKAAEE